jgi:uncharacterized protein (TIGR02466 family)
MDINEFFPTLLGSVINPDHDVIQEELVKHCLQLKTEISSGGKGWLSNKTYNTSDGKYNIFLDDKFKNLNDWVKDKIYEYCSKVNIDTSTITSNGSWFNIYGRNDFQENHVHPTSVISAIYILTCSDDGAMLFFNSPVNNMYHVKKTNETQQTVGQIICKSIPGTLIIFPSHLSHAVERHESDHLRISLSYNFKQ